MLMHVHEADSLNGPLQDALGKTGSGKARSSQSVNKFFFDFSIRRLLPRGLIEGGNDEGERMVRRKLWAQYGRAMHFIHLAFEDANAERECKTDFTRRNKRWVEYAVLLRAVVSFVYTLYRVVQLVNGRSSQFMYYVGFPLFGGIGYGLQYLQIVLDREFVLRNFQHVIFFWAMLQATWVNVLVWLLAPGVYPKGCDHQADVIDKVGMIQTRTVETITTFTILALIMYRMRFIWYLYVNIWLVFGYYGSCLCALIRYGNSSPCAPVRVYIAHVAIICCGLVFLSFQMEILQRKDFVQASMVYKESRRSDELLDNILPSVLIERLKNDDIGSQAIAESHACVTVLFADVVSFTTMSAQISAPVLVQLLDAMFLRFDDLAVQNGVEKIKTIGDCYMAAAGLPLEDPNHAKTMARFGLAMLELVASGEFRNPVTEEPIRVRVGLHSGPCVAGVIGHKKFAYDIWGDTVNTASRMESHGEPMKLHCSVETFTLLEGEFVCEHRGPMYVKGKGEMETYFICAKKTESMIASSQIGSSMISIDLGGDSFTIPPTRDDDSGSRDVVSSILSSAKQCIRRVSSLGQERSNAEVARIVARSSSKERTKLKVSRSSKEDAGPCVELQSARIQT